MAAALAAAISLVQMPYSFADTTCTLTCYVAATGADTNSGATPEDAFLTIQKAIDTVAEGGTVSLAAGEYHPAGYINIAKSVSLIGAKAGIAGTGQDASPGSVIYIPGATVDIAGSGSIVFDGLTFAGSALGHALGIRASAFNGNIEVRNSIFRDKETGIYTGGNTSLTVTGNLFLSTSQGINFQSSASASLIVTSNQFEAPGVFAANAKDGLITIQSNAIVGGIGRGILIQNSRALSVTNNTFTDSGSGSNIPIEVRGDQSGSIQGNTFTRPAGDATIVLTKVGRSAPPANLDISGNTITDPPAATHNAIWLKFAADTTIAGNTITGVAGRAVYIDAGATGTIVSANTISGVGYGVFVGAPAQVTGNMLSEAGSAGVSVGSAAGGSIVTDNSFVDAQGLSSATVTEIDATCNWWGVANGPSGVGPGEGDPVTSNASFRPWRTGGNVSAPCDTDAPSITVTSPVSLVLVDTTITAEFSCDGTGSEISRCAASDGIQNGDGLGAAEVGAHSFTIEAEDLAGNTAVKAVTYQVVPMTLAIGTPVDGSDYRQGEAITADFSCASLAPEFPVVSCTARDGDRAIAKGTAIDTATVGTHSFTAIVETSGGLTAEKSVQYTVRAAVPPTVMLMTPVEGAKYTQGAAVIADYRCSAGDYEIVACKGATEAGTPIDTCDLGPHTFAVEAKDAGGQTASRSISYEVVAAPVPAPVVIRVTPTSALAGMPVMITGEHFAAATGVTFNDRNVDFTVVDDATIRATIPTDMDIGPVTIRVNTPHGHGGLQDAILIVAPPMPALPPGSQPGDGNPPALDPPAPDPAPTYTLDFGWTLVTWAGADGTSAAEALREGSVWDDVTAIYSYDATDRRWLGFFPRSQDIPRANDLERLFNGQAYWIAVDAPGGTRWAVPGPP